MNDDFDQRFFDILQRRLLESRHRLWKSSSAGDGGGGDLVSDASNRSRASRLIGICDRARAFTAVLRESCRVSQQERAASADANRHPRGFGDGDDGDDDDDESEETDEDVIESKMNLNIVMVDDPSVDDASSATDCRLNRGRLSQKHVADLLRLARSTVLPLSSSASGPSLHPLGAQLESKCVSATNFNLEKKADVTRRINQAEQHLNDEDVDDDQARLLRVLHIGALSSPLDAKQTPEPVAGGRTQLRCANVSLFEVPRLAWKSGEEIATFDDDILRLFSSPTFRYAVDHHRQGVDDNIGQPSPSLVSEVVDAACSIFYT